LTHGNPPESPIFIVFGHFLSKEEKECAAGEFFDDSHENVLESVKAIHYPKGERSAPQAKFWSFT